MKKEIIHTIKILITAFILSLGISTIYAWTAPTQAPPAGNTSAPINVGSIGQYKSSNLGIGGEISAVTGYFSGNVGIGTAMPGAKLHVGDGTSGTGKIRLEGYSATGRFADIEYEGDNLYIGDSVNGTNLFIRYNGDVGIGTISPTGKLHITGGDVRLDNTQGIYFGPATNNGIVGDDSVDTLTFRTAASDRMTINGGDVGIGITNPSSKLEVDGDITASGGDVCNSAGDCLSTVGGGSVDWGNLINVPAGFVDDVDDVGTTPSRAVMAFDLASCPAGWSDYAPARDRAIIGSGSSYSRGATGGETTHTLTIAEIPSHKHSFPGSGVVGWGPSGLKVNSGANGYGVTATEPTGGGQPHNNMQPYLALLYCIKD